MLSEMVWMWVRDGGVVYWEVEVDSEDRRVVAFWRWMRAWESCVREVSKQPIVLS